MVRCTCGRIASQSPSAKTCERNPSRTFCFLQPNTLQKCEKSKDKPCGKCNGCKGKGGGKGGDQKGGAKDEGNKSGDKDHSTGDEETYTAKDDKKIIELKNDGKTWQEILDAIQKKSKSQLQNHWKNDLQAKAEGGGGDNDKKGDQKDGNAKDNQGKGGGVRSMMSLKFMNSTDSI